MNETELGGRSEWKKHETVRKEKRLSMKFQ
jgi:hypothetical protein